MNQSQALRAVLLDRLRGLFFTQLANGRQSFAAHRARTHARAALDALGGLGSAW